MKNFVKHIFAVAICAAALLSSCIKEEAYLRETAELSVSLTRAGTESVVQGDAINDAWIWAFQCTINDTTGAPTIDDSAVPMGSRYVSGLNSYGNISVHVPLPLCDGSQDYLLVAVINTDAFGDLNLTGRSTWGTIKSATFEQTGDFWDAYPKDLVPEVMPISNWATFTVTSENTHSSGCYQLNLPVYRAVAKSQLYMAKTGDFAVEVLDAKVVAKNGYSTGALLTANATSATGANNEAVQRGLPSDEADTWWWAAPTAITRTDYPDKLTYQMRNSDSTTAIAATTITSINTTTTINDANFDWVASTFLLENNNDAPYGTGCFTEAQGGGYNLYVRFSVDGVEKEVYTPLGKVVRNSDYQIKAVVDAGGELTMRVEVNAWTVDEVTLDYQDIATFKQEGCIKWSNLPTLEGWNAINDNGQVESGVINLNSAGGNTAQFSFMLDTPKGGTWIAELRTVKGNAGAIVFADGSSVMQGNIDNQLNTLTIKNLADNLASKGGVLNEVELHISAKGEWGGKERSYRVEGIVGSGVDFTNYKIQQPAQ